LQGEIPFGIYVNADDIEQMLRVSSVLIFDTYQIDVIESELKYFFKSSTFSPIKRNEPDLYEKLNVINNTLHISTKIDSYLAADIAEYIRQQLLKKGHSFTYETVMSHESKIAFLKEARKNDYRIYLYYIATEDPTINISRVKIRVAQNGHDVNSEVITNRYYKSLKLLKSAVKLSNRAYIWDNSNSASVLISEITNGEDVHVFDPEKAPSWFVKYLIE
jgi:predicted ABC-type ATPase